MRWQSGSLRGVEICAGLVDSGVESSTDGIDEPPAVIKRHSGHVTLHSAVWALCWTILARWAGDGGGDDDDDDELVRCSSVRLRWPCSGTREDRSLAARRIVSLFDHPVQLATVSAALSSIYHGR